MNLSIIVAADENNGIGTGGDQPFYIGDDLKRFKKLTSGNTIVMGRKTFESLPNGALPNRRNVVLSRDQKWQADGCDVINHPDELEKICPSEEKVFVIGGEEVFRLYLPKTQQIYMTRVHHVFESIDTWFPEPDPEQWKIEQSDGPFTDTKSGLSYSYVNYRRKQQKAF
ncbi:MAG: dihydrofolate reductase [Marinilabiliaceae bacterium]